jgi:hypothetical protein
MQKLTPSDYNRARDFLLTAARPLEKAIFVLEFEEGNVDEVLKELEKFQNPDGGFGKALEPDVRTPTSSALCTEMGLRYLAGHGVSIEHPMVQAAVKYFVESLDPDTQVWRVIPVDANDHPHAPWWHDEDGSLARTFDDYLVIPRAGVLALLYHYPELVPVNWLTMVTERTINDIENLETEKFGGGGDTLVYTRRLAEAPGLPTKIKDWLVPRVKDLAGKIVARDPAQWTEYCAPPLKLAPTPKVITAQALGDCIPAHLDYLIETQTLEGAWEPTWSWGDFYPGYWPQAKEEWRGILTLDTLIALRAFDRLMA